MKKVKFVITLETHEGLDEKDLKHTLEKYLINEVSMFALVQKVIGEKDCPENFSIKSVSFRKPMVFFKFWVAPSPIFSSTSSRSPQK